MTDPERYYRARRDDRLVVLEGFHAIKHALRFGAEIDDIVTSDPVALLALAAGLAPDLASQLGLARHIGPDLAGLTPTPPRTPAMAIARRPAVDVCAVFDAIPGPVVILDRPRHPGNIGAAVRVAAAAGAAGLFTTGDADAWGPAAVRGAAGLQYALPVGRIAALPETRRAIVAVDPEGEDLMSFAGLADPVLVFGSERDGISEALLASASVRVRIPMREGVSSLNLATAVAVMLYGLRRR